MKKTNGVTLVTLVITIIIMLILIGVGSKIVIESNLIPKTEDIVDNTNNILAKEQNKLDKLKDELEITAQQQCNHKWGDWEIISEATCNLAGEKRHICTKCEKIENIEIAPLPHTFVDGVCTICEHELVIGAQILGYNPTIAEDGNTINTCYISLQGEDVYTGNGYADQTFQVSSTINWRIIGEENGQIKIVADPILTTENLEFYLKGQAGYVNSINELDNISGIYGQGKYADISKYNILLDNETILTGGRSIRIEDVGITQSSTGTSKTFYMNEDGYIETNGVVTTSKKFIYYDETEKIWKSLGTGEDIVMTEYDKVANEHTEKCSDIIKKTISGEDIISYWFASKYNSLYYDIFTAYCLFRGSSTSGFYGIQSGYHRVVSSNGASSSPAHAIRPIVYLKSNIGIIYNETTNTYTIK